MPPEATPDDDDKVTSFDLTHTAVLKRFDEVATKDYPFPLPERTKPKSRLVNPKSKKNLQPLLYSVLLFLTKIICPPLTFLLILIAFLTKGTLISSIVSALAVICLLYVLSDPFFVHWITDGRFGNLGNGGDGTNNHGSAKKDGIYCADNPQNNHIRTKLQHFLNYRPTPYLYSGDLLTLAPFLLFKGSKGGRVPYKRWWIKVPSAPAPDGTNGPTKRPTGNKDDEAVALDIVFPPQGYQSTKVTFLVLHGLNGGSTEPYVLDLARRATSEGCTVGVMISRGLMKTPVKGMDSFHGARTSDVGCVVEAMLYALSGGERRGEDGTTTPNKARIVLVGFSMGGIVAANYVAKSGENSGLVGAISFSGTLCSQKMLLPIPSATHSLRVWQPALAWGLKCTIVKPNQINMIKRGITVSDVEGVRTVVDIDTKLVCKYHGYDKVQDYYEDMSAAGHGDEKGIERLKNVKVPLLAVHAIDDPIAIFEVTVCDDIVTKTENVIVLATKHGGHIGWPKGLFPSTHRWSFMIDIAMEYASTVVSPE